MKKVRILSNSRNLMICPKGMASSCKSIMRTDGSTYEELVNNECSEEVNLPELILGANEMSEQ